MTEKEAEAIIRLLEKGLIWDYETYQNQEMGIRFIDGFFIIKLSKFDYDIAPVYRKFNRLEITDWLKEKQIGDFEYFLKEYADRL